MSRNIFQILSIVHPTMTAALLAFGYNLTSKNAELRNQNAELANMVNRLQEDVFHLSRLAPEVQNSAEKINVITNLTEKTPEIVYTVLFYTGLIICAAVIGAAAFNAFSTEKIVDSIEKSNGLNTDLSGELLEKVSQIAEKNISNVNNQSERVLDKLIEIQQYLIVNTPPVKIEPSNMDAIQKAIDLVPMSVLPEPTALDAAEKVMSVVEKII